MNSGLHNFTFWTKCLLAVLACLIIFSAAKTRFFVKEQQRWPANLFDGSAEQAIVLLPEEVLTFPLQDVSPRMERRGFKQSKYPVNTDDCFLIVKSAEEMSTYRLYVNFRQRKAVLLPVPLFLGKFMDTNWVDPDALYWYEEKHNVLYEQLERAVRGVKPLRKFAKECMVRSPI